MNRGFLAVQNLADFPGDLAADVLQEQAVDVLDLLDGIELVEEVGLVLPDVHVQVFHVPGHKFLPEQGIDAEVLDLVLDVAAHPAGEPGVKIGVAIDAQSADALPAAVDAGDAAGLIAAHQQLLGGVVHPDGGVESIVLVGEEGVVGKVVVAVADVELSSWSAMA